MKTSRFTLTAALLGLSLLAGATAARACKYCWAAEAAAGDLSQQSLLPSDQANNPPGAFPLDNTINQFKPAALPTAIATPPPAGSIATTAADLRPGAKVPTTRLPSAVAAAQPAAAPAAEAGHMADAGLLGLAAAGGVFCWRTRRKTGLPS